MEDRKTIRLAVTIVAVASLAAHGARGQTAAAEPDTPASRILKSSPTEQSAWIKDTLEQGVPFDRGDVLTLLILGKSSLTLPIVEQKIEEVLQSKSPRDCFTNKSVNPERFVVGQAIAIAEAGNDEAMRQVAKLLKLDQQRFGDLVDRTLMETESVGNPENQGNPYIVAYHSLEMGEPLVEKRIYAWIQARLAEKDQYRIRDPAKILGGRDGRQVQRRANREPMGQGSVHLATGPCQRRSVAQDLDGVCHRGRRTASKTLTYAPALSPRYASAMRKAVRLG